MLEISFGKNRSEKNWKADYLEWDEFVDKIRKVRRTKETMAEYDAMSTARKGKVKDGYAFVGGLIKGGRRKKENIENRWLITLDVDYGGDEFLMDTDLMLGGTAHLIYSTHSHRPDEPKYRLVVPVDREMTADEYAAVSRKLADQIGMDYFDKTTFDVHRLMYTPSCSKDAEPIFEVFDGEPLAVESILEQYGDWRDMDSWPRHAEEPELFAQELKKRPNAWENPQPVIRAFCSAYEIEDGVREFLPDVYEQVTDGRWTFKGGSTVGGMRTYDDGHAYSEHQSDPANNGHCHNLFDLVRIHKYGEMDYNSHEKTNITKLPSYQAMSEFVVSIPEVKKALSDSRLAGAQEDFTELDDDWKAKLKYHSKTGEVLPTAGNAEIILTSGKFKGALAYDAFGNTEVIRKNLPWRERERPQQPYEPWLGADDNRRDHWFDKYFGIKSARTIQNAFTEVAHMNRFHPIKDYIEAFQWDGVSRVDTLFIDYLGATDSHYTRQVTRKMLVAAVKRLYESGCKFDEMLVLIGPQGAGKSSILAKLGGKWFSDSLRTFENKEAGEHLQSAWIFEIGELSAMKKSEVEEVKAFLSKTEDKYRVAFDRIVSDFPRKCVFFGTTNTRDFLRDSTGNRRFWPVEVVPEKAKYSHWEHLTDELIGQIWAEALHLYQAGETLSLDAEAAEEAKRQQTSHMESDPREGLIQDWLESPIEDEWGESTGQLHQRVCASQIWTECLGNRKGSIRPWEAKEICDILRRIDGWEEIGKVRVQGYGQQRAFERIKGDAVR